MALILVHGFYECNLKFCVNLNVDFLIYPIVWFFMINVVNELLLAL